MLLKCWSIHEAQHRRMGRRLGPVWPGGASHSFYMPALPGGVPRDSTAQNATWHRFRTVVSVVHAQLCSRGRISTEAHDGTKLIEFCQKLNKKIKESGPLCAIKIPHITSNEWWGFSSMPAFVATSFSSSLSLPLWLLHKVVYVVFCFLKGLSSSNRSYFSSLTESRWFFLVQDTNKSWRCLVFAERQQNKMQKY